MPQMTFPIVGAHFRPPAKGILAALAASTPLILIPEPGNPYDPNAIQVIVDLQQNDDQDWDLIERECSAFGFTIDQLRSQGRWHLGYVPRENPPKVPIGNASLIATGVFGYNDELGGELAFGPKGQALVLVNTPD